MRRSGQTGIYYLYIIGTSIVSKIILDTVALYNEKNTNSKQLSEHITANYAFEHEIYRHPTYDYSYDDVYVYDPNKPPLCKVNIVVCTNSLLQADDRRCKIGFYRRLDQMEDIEVDRYLYYNLIY